MFGKKSVKQGGTPSTVGSAASSVQSPFFAPSKPQRVIRTPGGTQKEVPGESKSSVTGASFNLINAIVGAGIVGIPFAVRESGLVAGTCMILLCAFLTVKSLNLLVDTAKHVDVPTYETLAESCFGPPGFVFVSLAMFVMSYGAMISYLMIVKSTLPRLLGLDESMAIKNAVMLLSSLCLILPISLQPDMANLSKTSILSVCFDTVLVIIVVVFSPSQASVDAAGGVQQVLRDSIIKPSTFFIGLGVLSFAFVCQHSAFIICGSLDRPTRIRWAKVCLYSLTVCAFLATLSGVTGYLGFLQLTQGNILNNLGTGPFNSSQLQVTMANVARGLLCTTMFFVYPMESFVCRHVMVVLLFKGRQAHEGDDHSVLSRKDRRVAVTVALYLSALIPAMLFSDLGDVLAVTGALGGSSLSYIAPGAIYIAVHGERFLDLTKARFGERAVHDNHNVPNTSNASGDGGTQQQQLASQQDSPSWLRRVYDGMLWYLWLMPAWCAIATLGKGVLKKYQEAEMLKSPAPVRLGKIKRTTQQRQQLAPKQQQRRRDLEYDEEETNEKFPLVRTDSLPKKTTTTRNDNETLPLVRTDSLPKKVTTTRNNDMSVVISSHSINRALDPASYGAANAAGNRGIAAAIAAKQQMPPSPGFPGGKNKEEEEDDPQKNPPTAKAFVGAAMFVVFGIIAASAGLFSVFAGE